MSRPVPSRSGPLIPAGGILALLVVAGAALRLVDLGAISFRWDEDLSALAAKAIAEHGIPELPSGMIYLRGLLFSYAMAASGLLLGFGEAALRLPAAIVGVAMIPLSFAFGRRLFGTGVALALAALVTFSMWDIEFSRYARMYAPFALFYLLTLLLIWRYRVVEDSLAGGALAVASALVAVSLHDLGYTLALAFLVPAAIEGRAMLAAPRRLIFPAAAFTVVAAAFFAWRKIQDRLFYRAAALAERGSGAAAAPFPAGDGGGGGSGLVDLVADMAGQARWPEPQALSALHDTARWAAIGIVAAALAFAAGLVAAGRRSGLGERAALGAIALCCALQLFNVALLAALALAFSKRRGIAAFAEPALAAAGAMIAVGFAAWLAIAIGLDLGERSGAAGVKDAVRALLDYPSFFVFWGFPREYPLMSIPALIGMLWAFDRAARPQPDRAAAFLLATFALPVVLNGLFETRYGFFRYNVPFGALYFAFVALGLLRWTEVVAAALPERRFEPARGSRAHAAGTAVLAALVVAFDVNPLRGFLVATRDHSEHGAAQAAFRIPSFPDFGSASAHVLRHADEADSIIAFECREYFNYLEGELDYCLLSGTYRSGDELIQTYVDDGVLRDAYVGVPLIASAKDLERVLSETEGTTWLLASDSIVRNEQAIDSEFRRLIEESAHQVTHVARDDDTKVYRF